MDEGTIRPSETQDAVTDPTDGRRHAVMVLHDRGSALAASPGVDARVASLVAWAEQSGADVVVRSVVPGRAPRRARAASALRAAGTVGADLASDGTVVVVALNAPHMVLLALRLAAHHRVILDVCDSTADTARIALRSGLPLQAAKSVLHLTLVAVVARTRRTLVAYVTDRDRDRDRSLIGRGRPVLVPQTVDPALGELDEYVGPPERIVVAADYSAYHNLTGMRMLLRSVEDGSLEPRIPVELFGPEAPGFDLPAGVTYRGWAPSKSDIYRGQTAVFVPNVAEAGQQNKLLEALCARRPVLAGRAVAQHLEDGVTVSTYSSQEELGVELPRLASRRVKPGARWPAPAAFVTPLAELLGRPAGPDGPVNG